MKTLFFLVVFVLTTAAQAFCFNEAGALYQIDPQLLKVIAQQESSLSANAINRNRDKQGRVLSVDYGLMQVNSVHIPKLKKLGIITDYQDLLSKPCLNVKIGAWILAQHLKRCGVNWNCLGSYNAGFHPRSQHKRLRYAKLIYQRYVQ
ncbi:lytic transglycosylase domain-containing protein [Arsenophonus apicola]|uniref:Lytic transglycosylase domain-containing protein n=1 Tax=Arsenophonus apicola TaxID=2879119 RepID=A0ABY8NYF5_9GAMM|nr:lytic transglycosylase domain-containing protein [Arsenophonus apicola]WGO82287.1 lytic transglycosylase domain-containing protein [Arsenophonus apicola]